MALNDTQTAPESEPVIIAQESELPATDQADGRGFQSTFQIVSMLGGYRARVRGTRRRRYLAISALAVGAVWLLAGLIYYFDLAVPASIPFAIALTVLLPVAALVFEAARKPSLSDTATLIDRRLDDKQRLVTSVELMSKGDGAPSPLDEAQIRTSAEVLSHVSPKSVYPSRTPWSLPATGLALLLLALGLFTLKGGGFTPFGVGTLPNDEPVQAFVVPLTPEPELPPSEMTPEAEPTPTSAPEELTLDQNTQDQQQQAGATASQTVSPEEQAASSQQAQSDLSRLGRALDGQSVTQQAADALKQGNTDEAAQQLAELGKENDQVSQAAKEGLADALDQAAQDTSGNQQLRKAEQNAADALRNGDYKEIDAAMQGLADAMERTASNIVPQQELAENFPEQPPGNQQDSSQQTGNQQSQPAEPGAGQQDGGQQDGQQGGNPEGGPPGSGQSGQQGEGEGEESGQGGGQEPQSGEGQGQSGAPGQGTRVNGPKDPTDLDVAGNPFELEAQPEPGNTNPQPNPPQDNPGLTLDGGSGGSGASPAAPGDAVNVPGETGNVPLDRWDIIRRFFTPNP